MKKIKTHNVIRERVETYKDFTINLLYTIYDTYLGMEYVKTPKDREGHFNWCFGKVLSNFFDEEIDFYDNNELYEYFACYYTVQFYTVNKLQPLSYYEKFWNGVFDYRKTGNNKKIFEVLLALYEIFDKSISQKNEEPNPV